MNFKKIAQIALLSGAALVLQACGGGDSSADSFFMVTNTNKGHVCVYNSAVKATSSEGQQMATVLYYYYGYRGGERELYSGDVSCGLAKAAGARDPDEVISNDVYLNTIIPAYNARK